MIVVFAKDFRISTEPHGVSLNNFPEADLQKRDLQNTSE